MASCHGCGKSYCLDCGQLVDPLNFRCLPCLEIWEASDPRRAELVELNARLERLQTTIEEFLHARVAVKAAGPAGSGVSDTEEDAAAANRGTMTTGTDGADARSNIVGTLLFRRHLYEVTDGSVTWWVSAHGPCEATLAVESSDGFESAGSAPLDVKQLDCVDAAGKTFRFCDGESCSLWNAFDLARNSTQVFACSEW